MCLFANSWLFISFTHCNLIFGIFPNQHLALPETSPFQLSSPPHAGGTKSLREGIEDLKGTKENQGREAKRLEERQWWLLLRKHAENSCEVRRR